MSDVFMSYARKDLRKATQLASRLSSLGWNVFSDRRIVTGERWAEVIRKELDSSKCVVVLWSQASVGSRWVKLEANGGLEGKKLIPVRIEAVDLPFEFRDIQTADLSQWDGESHAESFERLVADIGSLLQAEPRVGGLAEKINGSEDDVSRESQESFGKEVDPEAMRHEGAEVESERGTAASRILRNLGPRFIGSNARCLFTIVANPGKFIKQVNHDSVEEFLKMLSYAVFLSVIGLIFSIPSLRSLGVHIETVSFVLLDTIATVVIFVVMGLANFCVSKLLGGTASLKSSVVVTVYMSTVLVLSGFFLIPMSSFMGDVLIKGSSFYEEGMGALGQGGRSAFANGMFLVFVFLASIYWIVIQARAFRALSSFGMIRTWAFGILSYAVMFFLQETIAFPVSAEIYKVFMQR
jgi:hypothetical protein